VGVGETDGAATGTVDEPVGLGEADEVAEEVGLGVAVVLGVTVPSTKPGRDATEPVRGGRIW
jgi:putative aminopeptidase FrvX